MIIFISPRAITNTDNIYWIYELHNNHNTFLNIVKGLKKKWQKNITNTDLFVVFICKNMYNMWRNIIVYSICFDENNFCSYKKGVLKSLILVWLLSLLFLKNIIISLNVKISNHRLYWVRILRIFSDRLHLVWAPIPVWAGGSLFPSH